MNRSFDTPALVSLRPLADVCVCVCTRTHTHTLHTHTHTGAHKYIIVRAGEGGSESAVLRNRFAGQWRTILGEQCYLTGVHYLAVRVEGFSRNGLPTT